MFLAQPTPRSGGQEFLAQAQARGRSSIKVLAALLALPLVVVVAAAAPYGAATLLTALASVAGLVLLVGVPVWLYTRQDATLGPRLLRDGVVVPAQVEAGGADPTGGTLLRVVTAGEAPPRTLVFLVPLAESAAQALVGQAVSLVSLPGSPGSVGIALEGHGLVTSR